MKITVIVLNWNGKEDTLRCLASLQAVTTPHTVVVVDNGSTDDSVTAIARDFPKTVILQTGQNLGYAEGNNVGLRHALAESADAILILNNDTRVDPGILEAFMKRDLPIQGGKLVRMEKPEQLDHLGGRWNIHKAVFDLVGLGEPANRWCEPTELDYICGCAIFAKAEVFHKAGLFDPLFFLIWEECDWCYRASRLGYRSTFCPEAIVHHRVSASFSGSGVHNAYYWWRNRLLWMSLHRDRHGRFRSACRVFIEVLDLLRSYASKSLRRPFLASTPERRRKRQVCRASLAGVWDYCRRRLGAGPAWLTEKSESTSVKANTEIQHE